ncbi:GNAT family N-acetyltransferase [Actinoplanes sp. NPDC051633]|uniref:GNAT family N-acetyltransferase n=1 Tax=Actinoplanes sp. NPDC051633 TaxID=3155670 RepID=UPI00342E6547
MKPPEIVAAGELVLKRWELRWADEAAAAVRESLPELQPFLPWARDDYDVGTAREFVERSDDGWADGTEFNYAIFDAAGELVGSIGLMTRMGPGVLEIGYWLRTSRTGQGYMTAAVEAITRVAFELPGIDRAAIRHDVRNARSAAVAERAGFVEVQRRDQEGGGTEAVRIRLRA